MVPAAAAAAPPPSPGCPCDPPTPLPVRLQSEQVQEEQRKKLERYRQIVRSTPEDQLDTLSPLTRRLGEKRGPPGDMRWLDSRTLDHWCGRQAIRKCAVDITVYCRPVF